MAAAAGGPATPWREGLERINAFLAEIGMVGRYLAAQSGDEVALLGQLIEEAGMTVANTEDYAGCLNHVTEKVKKALAGEPLEKRLRGEYLSIETQQMADALEAGKLAAKSAMAVHKKKDEAGMPQRESWCGR